MSNDMVQGVPGQLNVPEMTKTIAILAALTGLLFTSSAHAAKPSCTRGGANVLLKQGDISVVSLTPKQKGGDVPQDKVYGCWGPSGKRFLMFKTYLSDEGDDWSIVGGRYIGVYRSIEAGVAGSADARSWDARKGVERFGFGTCPADPSEDEVSDVPHSAVFYAGGGIAYTCGDGSAHLVDAKGERALEAGASALAVTSNG